MTMARTRDDGGTSGPFERFATRVGDLDSPFYDEERERDVWNEASAVAFQLLVWASPLVAAAVLWIGGAGVLAPVALMLIPWAAAAGMALAYAQRHRVDPANDRALSAGRLWAWAGVMVVLGGGVLRAGLEPVSVMERFGRGVVEGAGVGLAIGGPAVALIVHWLRVRRDR
jgi:hypothetical protein